jgi:hypothetical protein
VKAYLAACLFLVACKGEQSNPAPAEKPTPTEVEGGPQVRRERPSLPPTSDTPDSERVRPQLPDGEQMRRPDFSDPAVREEFQRRREERRLAREARLDLDKDGVVSPEERQARLRPMIERFDQNGDGKLTPDELASSDRRMGFDDPAALDTDKDGEISLGELDAAMQQRRERMRERWRGRGGRGSADLSPD